jgi:hypothetical protein
LSYARDLVAENRVKNDLKEATGITGNFVKLKNIQESRS